MAVGPIVTRGFGSFGSIGLVVLAGYGSSAPPVPYYPDVELTLSINRTVSLAPHINRTASLTANINRTVTDQADLTGN